MRLPIFTVASLAMLAATPALARSNSSGNSASGCKSESQTQASGTAKNGHGDLSNKLASCGGVLKPPAVGDNIAKPAPNTGKSRIVKPKDLPAQQSPDAPKKQED